MKCHCCSCLAILVAACCCVFTACEGKSRPAFDFDEAEGAQAAASQTEPVGETTAVAETASTASADTPAWGRFRGPNGTGVSTDARIPTRWSEKENLAWKTKLPGAGSSSPVLTKQFVFVTSYSGYGTPGGGRSGNASSLVRQLSCIDRKNGTIVWTQVIANKQDEDGYTGNGLPEHGYASNTPVVGEDAVYVFYGKTGVVAYDFAGNEQWRKSVGTSSGNRRWGSAASLLLIDDRLIVNAADESKTIFALNRKTGEVVWDSEAGSLELCYSTPAVVKVDDERTDLVVAVAGEVWGLNPKNGKLVWYVETNMTGNLSPSVVADGDTVYVFGGYRSKGSVAIKVGGAGDIADKNVIWESRTSSYVPTPVLHDKRLYWIDDKGIYYSLDAITGKEVVKTRAPVKSGRGRSVYASPVVIGGKIYAQTRYSGLMVFNPGDTMDLVEQNRFDDDSQFNGTPAVDNGQLFLRSDKFLYCVSKTD